MGKKKKETYFHMLYEAYPGENADEAFQSYMNDKEAVIAVDGRIFYRALQIFIWNIGKEKLVALLDNRLNLQIGDRVTDDNGNVFTVTGFEMIRLSGGISDWYRKTSFVALSGDYETIGHCFAKLSS